LLTIDEYNKAIIKISTLFAGLPYPHALLIRSLITLADPTTGIVSNISYCDLANLLTVTKAPGRKGNGTLTKRIIRNYIQSIEQECGDYFKVITEGQKFQFLFPGLPKILNEALQNCTNLSKLTRKIATNNPQALEARNDCTTH
jgi:hypothetical protein